MTPALLSLLAALALALATRGGSGLRIPPRLRRPLGGALLGLALLLLLARQFPIAAALAAGGLALLLSGAGRGRGREGGRSTVRTEVLEMALDHETGEVDGRVLSGPFEDRALSDMALDELLSLAADVDEADSQSLALLRSYLDRAHPSWREEEARAEERVSPAASGAMTRETAYAVLGLEPGADADAVREAHRRLMKRVHPDLGGSEALAAQINQAKDLLLGR